MRAGSTSKRKMWIKLAFLAIVFVIGVVLDPPVRLVGFVSGVVLSIHPTTKSPRDARVVLVRLSSGETVSASVDDSSLLPYAEGSFVAVKIKESLAFHRRSYSAILVLQ